MVPRYWENVYPLMYVLRFVTAFGRTKNGWWVHVYLF